ncbi:hypothetical protein AB1Y20_011732 [Prymnesium parvum]|uniref:DUF218 domain-containing protein n=1 Tax=Prymnesium parvum TaxID=97485 RepID=A0AB34IHD1_PRYPA
MARGRRRRLAITAALATLTACVTLHWLAGALPDPHPPTRYDAVVVPGGGMDGIRPLPWVAARLDAALHHEAHARYFVVLSRGTTHKPPPRDAEGFPVDEAAASAAYLLERGVPAPRLLLEAWSLDTIGNAVFTRLMHAEPRGWTELLVITSNIHLPRTRAIFEWVFALPPTRGRRVSIDYEGVAERGLSPEQIASRDLKERQALERLQGTMARVRDLAELHAFLFQEHSAYAAPKLATESATPKVREVHSDSALAATY